MLQVSYQWQDSAGNPLTSILDLPEANPGTPSAPITLKLNRVGIASGIYVPSWATGPTSETRPTLFPPFDNQPIIVESELKLGATLWNRGVSGGSASDGSEMVAESWLEYSTDGTTWHALGAGPDESIASAFGLSLVTSSVGNEVPEPPGLPGPVIVEHYPAIPATQTVAIQFRLNIPEDAVTTGDFRAHLEVFAR